MNLSHPMPGAYISQRYGENPFKYGYGAKGHMGLDFGGCAGQPVRAMHDGQATVHWSERTYGQWVVVVGLVDDHLVETRYAHLVRGSAKGGMVKRGEEIGIVGNTGNSTGAHLHLELWIDGARVDPEPYLVMSQPESSPDWYALAVAARWSVEEAVRALEDDDTARALELLRALVEPQQGALYQIERRLE